MKIRLSAGKTRKLASSTTESKRDRSKLRPRKLNNAHMSSVYPFSAIVGQEETKLALLLNAIDPSIGGVLLMGHRGTGKSTAVRALADLLPEITAVQGCRYHCHPADKTQRQNRNRLCTDCERRVASGEKLKRERITIPVVDLPLGATEDRICGAIDIERALGTGVKAFEPGLLARANRGFLYIDEVNLLEDHLVDLLLDVSVTGINRVERENISIEHPASFLLIGSGNPEEGELRPQLVDRFGLQVEVKTETDPDMRVEIVERRDAFERNPETFHKTFAADQKQLRKKITRARAAIAKVEVNRDLLRQITQLCSELNVDGHRGELTIMRAARARAAFGGRRRVNAEDVRAVAAMAVRHRLRRDVLEETPGTNRINETLAKVLPETHSFSGERNEGARGSVLRVVGQKESPGGDVGSDSKFQALLTPISERSELQFEIPKKSEVSKSPGQQVHGRRGKKKGILDGHRGRYSGALRTRGNNAIVAVDATLRAAALLKRDNGINKESLRYKRFARKSGTLFIFAIDASGSMAINRINQARVAILGLLRESYINRDRVAIVTFRGRSAEVVLSPSRSILRARLALDSIALGGGTPLPAGLSCVLKLAKRERMKHHELVMLLFTDGGANVAASSRGNELPLHEFIDNEIKSLGAELVKAGVSSVVVDTQNRFRASAAARELAERLAARYKAIHEVTPNRTK